MKPVAFMRPSTDGYDSAFRDAQTIETSTEGDWSEWIPLFSTDQLREAQAKVLRKAALRMPGDYSHDALCRMADELEHSPPIL